MLVLNASSISKSFLDNIILKDVSFSIYDNDKIGLVGENGSGKTTLLNILNNKISSDTGDVFLAKNINVSILEQNISYSSNNTVYEECLSVFDDLIILEKELRDLEILMGDNTLNESELEKVFNEYEFKKNKFEVNGGYIFTSKIKGVLNGLGFEVDEYDKYVNVLSGGQKTRLHLAKILLRDSDLLFLDEPTNHLDMNSIRFLENYLKDYKGSLFVISHDRYFLNSVCNKIFDLNNKHIDIYNCKYDEFIKRKEHLLSINKKIYENQQKELLRQNEIIQRFENYGNNRFIKQANSRKKRIEKMDLIENPEISKNLISLKLEPEVESGKDVLQIFNLSMSFKEKELFSDLNLNIYKGDKIGLIGGNGVGKTTLFKIICKFLEPKNGFCKLGSRVKIGYFDQEQKSLSNNKTVIEEFWDAYPKFNYYEIRSYLAKFNFFDDDINKDVAKLSGGERARLELLKLMLSNANFLVLDEPTNHLDIYSKEVLEKAIIDYTGTVFVISHDRYFLNKTINKIWNLENKTVLEYYGNYDYYIEKINENNDIETEKVFSRTLFEKEKRKKREIEQEEKKKKKKLLELENNILIVEEDIEKINLKIQDPQIYEDKSEIDKYYKKLSELMIQKDTLYTEWENYL